MAITGINNKRKYLKTKDAAKANAIPQKNAGLILSPSNFKEKYIPASKKNAIGKSGRNHKNSPKTLMLDSMNKYM